MLCNESHIITPTKPYIVKISFHRPHAERYHKFWDAPQIGQVMI